MTSSKVALAMCWLMIPTFGGVLGFVAIGWYNYLLLSATTGLIAWSMLSELRSKKTYLVCIAISAIAGILSRSIFGLPDGSISENGIMLIALPALLVLGFLAMKIYFIEVGNEHD